MNLNQAKYYLFLFFVLIGCCKETNNNNCKCCPKCNDLPSMDIPVIYYSNNQYKYPYYNPNNNNEIIYYYSDYENNTNQLVKYDILQKTKTILIDNIIIISQPKWGINDWILLNNIELEIWKIKSNGDSLINVAAGGSNLFPEWNANNTSIIYTNSETGGIPYNLISKNILTNINDTIFNDIATHLSISNTNVLAATFYMCNISLSELSDYLSWHKVSEYACVGNNTITCFNWHPNSLHLFCSKRRDGIFKIDTKNNIEIKIKNACDSKFYKTLSVSPDGDKLITERIDGYISNDNKLFNDSKIYIMDINGCNEQEIKID